MDKDYLAKWDARFRWTGRIISALPVFLLLFSATMKLLQPEGVAAGFEHMGWPVTQATGLALLELACVVIYLIPRTALLGAILLTGYLGGVIATHVRVGDSSFIPIMIAILLWGGLYLRDSRLWVMLPLRR